jgi:hypothetical protein
MNQEGLIILKESIKVFLQSVIKPPLDEIGGLLADEVKYWRFKNQVRIISKAENLLKNNKIRAEKTSLKLLVPILENSGLEEDNELSEKWAFLLANTVRENSEIQTNIYSYILSQMTSTDADVLMLFFDADQTRNPCIHLKELTKLDKRYLLVIDNLIRLRLIKGLNTYSTTLEVFTITDLGNNFMRLCTVI